MAKPENKSTAESCGLHYPNACAGYCPNRGDRFSKAQVDFAASRMHDVQFETAYGSTVRLPFVIKCL